MSLVDNIAASMPELEALACSTCGQRRPITAKEAASYIFGGWPTCKQGHAMERLITVKEARGEVTL